MIYNFPPKPVLRMCCKYIARLRDTDQLSLWYTDLSFARGKFIYERDRGVIHVLDVNTKEKIGSVYVVCAPQTTQGYIDEDQIRFWSGQEWRSSEEAPSHWIQHYSSEYALGWVSKCD